jgi:hypothetical protein
MNLLTQEPNPDSKYRTIPLAHGKFAIVDAADFEFLSQWHWQVHHNGKTWYAQRKENGKIIGMHRAIMGNPAGVDVDHRDRNGLHNWRGNLRIATKSQNQQNTSLRVDNKSGFTGVRWREDRQRYEVQIRVGGKGIYLGSAPVLEDAVKIRNDAAVLYHGEFARIQEANNGI